MITVIDYGMGNIGSVINMIRRIGGEVRSSSSLDEIKESRKLILPGVGAFDAGMTALEESGLSEALKDVVVNNGAHILGICLGMQLLLGSSEEGEKPGLGLVPGRVIRFKVEKQGLPVPHMGWNVVKPVKRSLIFEPNEKLQRFYFVHSYYVECDDLHDIATTSEYGHEFVSAFERKKVMGVQFHPEKSHRFGLELLNRLITL